MDVIASFFRGIFWVCMLFFILGTYLSYQTTTALRYQQLNNKHPDIAQELYKDIDSNLWIKLGKYIDSL